MSIRWRANARGGVWFDDLLSVGQRARDAVAVDGAGDAEAGARAHVFRGEVLYYAGARDLWELPRGGRLRLYDTAKEIQGEARRKIEHADLALCTGSGEQDTTAGVLEGAAAGGSRVENGRERPRAVSEYLAERKVMYRIAAVQQRSVNIERVRTASDSSVWDLMMDEAGA